MSDEIVRKLLKNKRKMLFESNEILTDITEEEFEDRIPEEDPKPEESEVTEIENELEETSEDELKESDIIKYDTCVCGSENVAFEDGVAICADCGRELHPVTELSEPLLPREEEEVKESSTPDKSSALRVALKYWNNGQYQKAMDICKKYGVSNKEFAYGLVASLKESEEVEDEEDIDESAFKVFHYEILSKKDDGKVIIKNFGYFSDEASFWKSMNSQYPKSRFIVRMTKPMQKTNEGLKEDAVITPDNKEDLDKNIIRAIQTPVSTKDRPNLDAAIMEAFNSQKSKSIKEALGAEYPITVEELIQFGENSAEEMNLSTDKLAKETREEFCRLAHRSIVRQWNKPLKEEDPDFVRSSVDSGLDIDLAPWLNNSGNDTHQKADFGWQQEVLHYLKSAFKVRESKQIKEAVDVDTGKWSHSSGKSRPSGYGMWWFKIGNDEVSFSGQYTEAKKKAIEMAKDKKVQRVILLP